MKKFINLNENDIKNLVFNTLKLYLNEAKGGIIQEFENYLKKWEKNGIIDSNDVYILLSNHQGLYNNKESELIRFLYRQIEGNKTREQQYRAPQIRKVILDNLNDFIYFDKEGNELNLRQIFNRTSPKKNTVDYIYNRYPNRDEYIKQQRNDRLNKKKNQIQEDDERWGDEQIPRSKALLVGDLIFERVSRIEKKDGSEVYLYRDGQKPWFIHLINETVYDNLSLDEQQNYKKIVKKTHPYNGWYLEHFSVKQYSDMKFLSETDYNIIVQDCISFFYAFLRENQEKNKEILEDILNTDNITDSFKKFNRYFIKLSTNKFRNKSGMKYFRDEKDVHNSTYSDKISDNSGYSNNENFGLEDKCKQIMDTTTSNIEYTVWFVIRQLNQQDGFEDEILNSGNDVYKVLTQKTVNFIYDFLIKKMGDVYKQLPEVNQIQKGINELFNQVGIKDGDAFNENTKDEISNIIQNVIIDSINNY